MFYSEHGVAERSRPVFLAISVALILPIMAIAFRGPSGWRVTSVVIRSTELVFLGLVFAWIWQRANERAVVTAAAVSAIFAVAIGAHEWAGGVLLLTVVLFHFTAQRQRSAAASSARTKEAPATKADTHAPSRSDASRQVAQPARTAVESVDIVSLDHLCRPYERLQLCERLLRADMAVSLALIVISFPSAMRVSIAHDVPVLAMAAAWAFAAIAAAAVVWIVYALLRAFWQGSLKVAWAGLLIGVVVIPWGLYGWILDVRADQMVDGTVWFFVAGRLEQMSFFVFAAVGGGILVRHHELRRLRPQLRDARVAAWQVSGIVRPRGSAWHVLLDKGFMLSVVALFLEGTAFYGYNGAASWLRESPGDLQTYLPTAASVVEANYLHLGVVCFLLVPLAFIWMRVLLAGAERVRNQARRAALLSAEQALALDARAPVLFLRPFADDHVSLSAVAVPSLVRVLDPETQRTYLEDLLQTCLSLGPVVSIGRPQDATPPLGVPRAYVGAHWQTAVIALMDISSLIVMAISDSEGVTWEVDQLAARGYVRKTVFIVPPGRGQDRELLSRILMKLLSGPIHAGDLGRALETAREGEHVVGLLVGGGQRTKVLTARGTPTRAHYDLTLRMATQQLAPADAASGAG